MAEIEGGYIKLYRKIVNWEWYSDDATFRIFLHLLLTANYEPKKWKGILIERGQLVTSISSLCETLKCSRSKMHRVLERLEDSGEIERKANTQFTIITIVRYNEYQDNRNANETQTERKRNANETQTERKADTTKEVKNIRNKETKEDKEAVISAPGSQEQNLIELYGIEATEKYKKRFIEWAEKRGKQNLDCIATIAKWMKQDNVPLKGKAEVNDGGTHTNFKPSNW